MYIADTFPLAKGFVTVFKCIRSLQALLAHFKRSTGATGKLAAARRDLGITQSLVSIGKTRFATIYYAGISVLENLPALYKIVGTGQLSKIPEVSSRGVQDRDF